MIYTKEYYLINKEKEKARQRKWRLKNKAKIHERNQLYYLKKHPKRIKLTSQQKNDKARLYEKRSREKRKQREITLFSLLILLTKINNH